MTPSKRNVVVCKKCGGEFHAPPSARRKYCSPECYAATSSEERRREKAVGWRSGESLTDKGYRLILCGKEHPMANNNGYVAEHRLVMAEVLGRHLARHEHVHHVNGDRLDNRPENLEVVSRGQHTRIHQLGQPSRNPNRDPRTGRFTS